MWGEYVSKRAESLGVPSRLKTMMMSIEATGVFVDEHGEVSVCVMQRRV